MKTEQAVNYFTERAGSRGRARAQMAKLLGINLSAVYQWGEWVPEKQAARLQSFTAGELSIDAEAPYAQHYMIV